MGSLCFPSHGVKSIVSTLTSNARHGSSQPLGSPSTFELGTGVRMRRAIISSRSQETFSEVRESNLVNRLIGQVYNQGVEGSVLEVKDSQMLENDLPLKYSAGKAHPLGASVVEGGINFALFSRHASSVIICLSISERSDAGKVLNGMIEVPLDPQKNKTGDIWHICVEVCVEEILYMSTGLSYADVKFTNLFYFLH